MISSSEPSQEKKDDIRKFLRGEMRSVEYNTISKLVEFFSFLMPIEDENYDLFNESCLVFSSLLLGFGDIKTDERTSEEQDNLVQVLTKIMIVLTEKSNDLFKMQSVINNNSTIMLRLSNSFAPRETSLPYIDIISNYIESFSIKNKSKFENMNDEEILKSLFEYLTKQTLEIPSNKEAFRNLIFFCTSVKNKRPEIKHSSAKLALFTPTNKMPNIFNSRLDKKLKYETQVKKNVKLLTELNKINDKKRSSKNLSASFKFDNQEKEFKEEQQIEKKEDGSYSEEEKEENEEEKAEGFKRNLDRHKKRTVKGLKPLISRVKINMPMVEEDEEN